MSALRPSFAAALVLSALALLSVPTAALAQDKTKADELHERGDYLFKSGYYFRASDNYRLALVEDPTNPWRKLAFGHSLFAIGKYGYASYALRRGVAELDPKLTFAPEIAPLFPSRRRFQQALRDLKRYVTYSPRDAAGLTVLGYVLYSIRGEERRSRDMFRYLLRLDPNDAFAASMIAQLDRRAKTAADGGSAAKDGHPVEMILKGFEKSAFEEVRNALRAHPGVSGIQDAEGLDQITISFTYAGPNLDTNLRNLLASLGITATLREQASTNRHLRTFLVEVKRGAPRKSAKKPSTKPKAKKKGPLKERVPVSKRERERLENEWPAPTPAKAK
jgi:tetratricopeptide (TPR) repeat protein